MPQGAGELMFGDREIEFAKDCSWFIPLYTNNIGNMDGRWTAEGYNRNFAIAQACALICLVDHHFSNANLTRLLNNLGRGTLSFRDEAKKLRNKAKKWQHAVLTSFILPLAKSIRQQHTDQGHEDICLITPQARKAIILSQWSERVCNLMWAPVAKYIDFDAIFHPPPEQKQALDQIHLFLRNSFLCAMEDAITIRLGKAIYHRAQNEDRSSENIDRSEAFPRWSRQNKRAGLPPPPRVGDLPVRPGSDGGGDGNLGGPGEDAAILGDLAERAEYALSAYFLTIPFLMCFPVTTASTNLTRKLC